MLHRRYPIALFVLAACGSCSGSGSTARPATITAHVTEAGDFDVAGQFWLQQIDGAPVLQLALNGLGRAGDNAGMGWGATIPPDAMRTLVAGRTWTPPAGSSLAYPFGGTQIARAVRTVTMAVGADHRVTLDIDLGAVTYVDPTQPLSATPADTGSAQFVGTIPVRCSVEGSECSYAVESDGGAGAQNSCNQVADPTLATQFCQTNIDAYGLGPLVR